MSVIQTSWTLDSEVERDLRIEVICERYEQQWRDGGRPPLTDALAEVEPPMRFRVLCELLACEIQWRRRWGESPRPEDYAATLAGHEPEVAAAFACAALTETDPCDDRIVKFRAATGIFFPESSNWT